ncbi:hypothetical protein [Microvirga pakistanensis]|uniref:hypothetical protein n=1 Tax=Microvirga pakistanensis TaxID=1682650 RepID=UPI00106A26C6|nr:hypothetical protein [Microvirga pakistanensis]
MDQRQVRVHPDHEFDGDVLLWIDETLPHAFRFLGQRLYDDIVSWVPSHTEGVWFIDIDPNQDGYIRFAELHDAEKFKESFGYRIW